MALSDVTLIDSGLTWARAAFVSSQTQAQNIVLKQDAQHRSASCGSNMLLVLSGCELLICSEINLKMKFLEIAITDASVECGTLKVKHINFLYRVF